MYHKKFFLVSAAVFLGLLLIAPHPYLAQSKDDARAKISAGLAGQLSTAAADEAVTAIVKMREKAQVDRIQGKRTAVFSEFRRTARVSQADLLNYLSLSTVRPKVELTRSFWLDNLVLVKATKDVVAEIAARQDVEKVFENYTVTLPPKPERTGPDRSSAAQQTQLWDSIDHIGVKQVWTSYGLTGSGVRVGGLDTGVDISHPDIAGKMITDNPADPTYPGGWAELDANGNVIPGSVPHDSDEHGTHTTGTMIGGSASGYDIGVAPDADLMHGLVIPGGSGTFAQVVGGMEWIIDPDNNPGTDDGAQVVNMSLGGTGTHTDMVAPTDNMVAAGVFPSFSIGNSGPGSGTTGSPGNVPSAFGVGATDDGDVIASFSSRGPVTWNYPPYVGTYIKPDMSAPGVRIYSSVPGGGWEWTSPSGDWSGTSMAAPHLSGTVALMLQGNPTMTVDQIKLLLSQTAIDLGTAGMDNNYGWGRVDAFGAVSAALVGLGTLEGTVYSSAGGVVENAAVLATDTGQRVHTDAMGHYSLLLVAGDYDIEVSRFGYETSTISGVTIVADLVTIQDVTLTQLPSGTVAGVVTDSQTGMGIAADITVLLNDEAVVWASTNPATGEYSVALPIGTYDLVFSPEFPYPTVRRNGIGVMTDMTTTLDVALMAAQILLVDDDVGDGYETYYEQAIAAAGRTYLTVATPPTAADMALFESVVWFTGDDYTSTLTSQDQAEIAAYLDGGGRLFMSGQDIGYDINTSAFYSDYLHAAYVQDNVGLGGVLGSPASPVGFGFMFDIKGGDGANNQNYPSEIDPVAPAMTAFVYDASVPAAASAAMGAAAAKATVGDDIAKAITSSGTAGLTFDNGMHKLVYLAFGFEAIATAGDRSLVMDRILDWLQGYPDIVHTPLGDTEDTENAYRVWATITSDFFELDPSSFVVVYDVGGPEITLPMAPLAIPEDYEAYIPTQPTDTQVNYYISASDVEGHTSTDPVGAPLYKHSFMVAQDVVPPVVEHMRLFDTNDLDGPYWVSAMVSDNIGVESVYFMYAKNGGLHHRVKMMMQPDGSYLGAISGPSEVGDIYEYHLYAMDNSYSGNVTRVPEMGAYSFEIVEEFVWDFEDYDGGFVPAGDVWEWGAPTTGPGAAHSGVNVWATVLGGNYPSYSDATLDIPPITLSAGKPYAILTFWHWYYIETNYDGGNIKVSTDGGATWDIVTPLGGYDGTARSANAGIPGEPCFTGYNNDFWQQEMFNLSAYAGQQVMIRFHFGSDGSVQRSGWYIDDVRLRSTDVDDIPPVISNTQVPGSTFDTVGPYEVSTFVIDPLSGLASVSTFYSMDDGATYTELAMSPGAGADEWVASIPGQPNGTRVRLYIRATDTASPSNESTDPAGAPANTYGFAVLPSAPILVLQMSSTASSLDMFRDALEANGHTADYWYRPDGWLDASKLSLYKTIILDETGSLTAEERTDLATFLELGTPGARKEIMVMGRDLGYYSSTRPWIEEYMRAAYVQDNPGWRELSGEAGEPIGAGETFVISGSYPDETRRSTNYPGGEIVYRYTAPGTAMETRGELQGAYEKDGKEWDGVMPHAPISLDAAAGIKYAGEQYRSVYFTFNFYYIQEDWRRAGIIDRALAWLSAPQILHEALHDSEDTANPYTAVAQVYSTTLDPTRVELTYDVGMGSVTVQMDPTGNPDEFAEDIPAQPLGTTVEYYLSASNLDGTMSYHPRGAPADQHLFKVGADIIPPEIVHTPHPNTADQAGPYTIEAMVTDNVGVDPNEVSLAYNKNGGTDVTVAMSSLGGDMYAVDIPGPAVVGDVFNYYITASDAATVPNTTRDPAAGYHSFEIVDYFAWDFEADDGGFAATGPDWEWGEPTTGPSGAYSGVNVWATKLGDNYSSSSDSRLHTIALTVPSSHLYASLSFWQWYYIENNYDGGNVKISTDGGSSWAILTPDIGYNGTATSGNAAIPGEPCFTGYNDDVWHKVTFDLTPYRGMGVLIRLHFGSDSSVQRVGWYVDDMRIESMSDTEGPAFVSTSVPASTYDDVGPYTVTSVVNDALSVVASATLYYSTDDGGTWTSVAMSPTGNPDEYSGDIPGQSSGTRIKLYVEASDNESNTSTDPAGAPSTAYEFGIMPSGDYLVLLGGAAHTDPVTFQMAFSAIGRTADIWDWDDLGLPTVDVLLAYQAIVIDESWYLDTSQMALLGEFLDTSSASLNKVFMMGRDLSYGSGARTWMEQYTGSAYVQDDPGWRELTSTPGDPIGADETFTIQGSYPDELSLSTTYPGGQVVYTYSGTGTALDRFNTEQDARAFYEKQGKLWDPKYWPFAPIGPDDAAGIRYVSATHASVYFSFNFNYIQEADRQAAILDRALNWLGTASSLVGAMAEAKEQTSGVPAKLTLGRNFPNPFNPVTRIEIGIPNVAERVSLKVYNVHGQLVKTVFEGTKGPGFHVLEWDGTNNQGISVSTGVYFARFESARTVLTRKMILLK